MSCDPLTVGSTYRFKPDGDSILKDGAIWDLTGATVSIIFERTDVGDELLDGTSFTRTATVSNAAAGEAYYDCLTTDLDVAGIWSRAWKVVQGSITITHEPVAFEVIDSP